MKNKIRAITLLLLTFLLILTLAYSTVAVKIAIGLLIGFVGYGMYLVILGIMDDIYPEDKEYYNKK